MALCLPAPYFSARAVPPGAASPCRGPGPACGLAEAGLSSRVLRGAQLQLGHCWPRGSHPLQRRGAPLVQRGSSVAARAAGRRRWFDGGRNKRDDRSELGPFPWERGVADADGWWGEDEPPLEMISFVTSEGVYRMPAQRPASVGSDSSRGGHRGGRQRRREADYMDPLQQLCLGAVFDIRALNGVSDGRYFRVDGFCRSVHMLSDVIADAVAEEGGEVLVADVRSSAGLNEKLHLTVVVPLLWGVPPKRDALRRAIHAGGGIVHRCFQEWQFI